MVGAKEAIEIDRPKFELVSVWKLEPRCSCRLLALVWLSGREIEEVSSMPRIVAAMQSAGNPSSRKIHKL